MDKIALLPQYCEQKGIVFALNEPLSGHCSFKIGGAADIILWPSSEAQIAAVLRFTLENDIRRMVLGKGSNVLFADAGFRGAVICLDSRFAGIRRLDDVTLECDSGASLMTLCRKALEWKLAGLEFAYGIPGSVGGAVYMNAGAYDGEMSGILLSTHHLLPDGNAGSFTGGRIGLGYRHSAYIGADMVITKAVVRLSPGGAAEIQNKMEDFMGRRKDKQPLEYPSAGSTFSRPPGAYASALIDQCGLKGRRVGGAVVSEKHAGFVVNTGGATCADVLKLMDVIKSEVLEKTGYELTPEVRIIPERHQRI